MLPGADDCLLALRGMRTLSLRLKDVERKALGLATCLKGREEVEKVLHPAFEDCPGHEYWLRDYKGSSGLFTVVLKEGFTKTDFENMIEQMDIFKLGFSWGGYERLVTPVNPKTYRTAPDWSYAGLAFRIQVGLEDSADLQRDLEPGLQRLAAGS